MAQNGLFPDVSRRDFIKTCMTVSAMLGLPFGMVSKVAAAAKRGDNRPAVIWLHFQECTGCSESLLRSTHPTISSLILDMISLDYHETLMAGSGHQAEKALHDSLLANRGNYILVVEGAIPTKDNGVYCKVGGRTAMDSLTRAADGALAIIAMGTCASYGGIQSVGPNPTGAVGVRDIIKDKAIINIPGCPPNPYNFLSTVLYYATFKKLPELDQMGRPKFAYGRKIHEHCERRPHFDAGRFAQKFGDEGHRQGFCLYKLGCKGPATHANCSINHFVETVGAWPVGIGAPCFGCTEQKVGFRVPTYDTIQVDRPTAPGVYPGIAAAQGHVSAVATGLAGLVAGALVGGGYAASKKLAGKGDDVEAHHRKEK